MGGQYIDMKYFSDMIPHMVLDFEYVYVVIWYKCILFLVLKAALG